MEQIKLVIQVLTMDQLIFFILTLTIILESQYLNFKFIQFSDERTAINPNILSLLLQI